MERHDARVHRAPLSSLRLWARTIYLVWQTSPKAVTLVVILTLLGGVIPSLQIAATKLIIENVSSAIQGAHTNNGQAANSAYLAVLFVVAQGVLVLFAALIGNLSQQVQSFIQLQLTNKISVLITEKALLLELEQFEDATTYDMLQRASQESAARPYTLFMQLVSLGRDSITLMSVTAVLCSWNVLLGFLVLLASVPSISVWIIYGRKGYNVARARASQYRRLSYWQSLITTTRSAKEIRLFGLGDYLLGRYRSLLEEAARTDQDLTRQRTLALMPFLLLSNLVSAGAQVYAVLVTIRIGSVGALAAYFQAIVTVHETTLSLTANIGQLYQTTLYIGNLFELLDLAPVAIRSGSRPAPRRLRTGIEFRNVTFRYPGTARDVLKRLSMVLRAGECTALVGRNGAGKTTIVKLLARLYEPTEGQILLESIPLEEYDLIDLRKHISVLFQDFMQYDMTARENIGFGNIDNVNDLPRIQAAARQGGADSVISPLPNSYETVLGRMFDAGQELSIGQWQKVALSRALMRAASLLVLDEPTASVDAMAEADLYDRMHTMAQGSTSLLIAHRFSTVRMADRILVLEDGRISEEGTHKDLMRRHNGTYAHLFRLQATGYLDAENQSTTIAEPIE
jgi:ATP-binding cassette subfamily B protein